jgi:amidase
MSADAVFLDQTSFGSGPTRVAIKDIIDVEGTITTAACRAVEKIAKPAIADAVCIRTIRAEAQAGRIRVVGKTNLHELAFGATGINTVYGTPQNPLDATRMPGGSSSGSAVAVAIDEADIALGSDTGGSIRIPASCCGVVGLKTTWGRIPIEGVWALSPFLDTIGPLARTVTDAITGMELLEPGFTQLVPKLSADTIRVARARPEGAVTDPAVDAAVDTALQLSEVNIVEVEIALWDEIQRSCLTVLLGEAWRQDKHLLTIADGVSEPTAQRLTLGASISDDELTMARAVRAAGLRSLESIFANADVIVMPSTPTRSPLLTDTSTPITAFTRFANLLGLPALSIPVPVPAGYRIGTDSHLPASLQIIGRPNSDELVCGVGLVLAAAVH